MELWNDLTLNVYGLAILLIVSIAPILISLFAVRVIGRSTRKTIRVLNRKK
jgi:hypothetical protein